MGDLHLMRPQRILVPLAYVQCSICLPMCLRHGIREVGWVSLRVCWVYRAGGTLETVPAGITTF
jgi:hypothetical protein